MVQQRRRREESTDINGWITLTLREEFDSKEEGGALKHHNSHSDQVSMKDGVADNTGAKGSGANIGNINNSDTAEPEEIPTTRPLFNPFYMNGCIHMCKRKMS